MNLNLLLGLLIVATIAATYIFWIRPLLKATPSLGYLYANEEAFWRAVATKFDGLKQKLVTALVAGSGFIVSAYDFLAPYVTQSGMDVTTLTDKVPPQVWPLIGIGLVFLLQYLRKLGDQSMLTKIATGESVVTLETPVSLNPEAPPVPILTPVAPADAVPLVEKK